MTVRWTHMMSAVAIASAALVGCASEGPTTINIPNQGDDDGGSGGSGGGSTGTSTGTGTPPPGGSAQDYFEQNVYPELSDSCGECHVSGVGTPYFLSTDAASSYSLVKGLPGYVTAPANSRLLLKGEHFGGDAPALSAGQEDIVRTWLEMELEDDPGIEDDPVELTPLQELMKFGSCMSFADFEQYPIYELANQRVIYQNNAVECDSCHDSNNGDTGLAGTAITPVPEAMFELTKQMPWILKFATVTLNEDGTFAGIVRANRWVEKCVESQLVGNPHPPCQNDVIDANVVEYINGFFDATYERYMNDECDLATQPGDEPVQ
jgi:hypothetical protein